VDAIRGNGDELVETAFVMQKADDLFDLRWFTPLTEVKLCGHATLASAYALWESGRLSSETTAKFETLSGVLTANVTANGLNLIFQRSPPALPTLHATWPWLLDCRSTNLLFTRALKMIGFCKSPLARSRD
jgi:predicted PhzF superfamily epimerase YddE/YHI9